MTSSADDGRSTRERMLAGEPYIADDPELAAMHEWAVGLTEDYNAAGRSREERQRILRELFASVGEDTAIRPPLYVDYGTHISIGARCFANYGLVALDVCAITIGDDVQIGPNVQLLTPDAPGRARPAARQVGGRCPDHDRRQRLAGRRRDRARRREHRRQHDRRRRRRGHQGPARERGRGRQPGPGHPTPSRT